MTKRLVTMLSAAMCTASLLALPACQEKTTKITNTPLTAIEKVCSRAYTGRTGARDKAMKAMQPEQRAMIPDMPERQAFIDLCAQLPEDAARCLDPNIVTVDTEGCMKALKAAPSDKLKAVKELFQNQPSPNEQKAKEEAKPAEEGAEGEATEGEATEGGATEGGAEEGEATEGEATEKEEEGAAK